MEHLDSKDKIISDLENNVVLLSNYLDTTVATIDTIKDRMQSLEAKAEESGQYSKRPSLRIAGLVPFCPGENFRKKVVSLAADFGVNISLSDIDRAHPAGCDKEGLLVKFTNHTARLPPIQTERN
jgi:hypothetical protein